MVSRPTHAATTTTDDDRQTDDDDDLTDGSPGRVFCHVGWTEEVVMTWRRPSIVAAQVTRERPRSRNKFFDSTFFMISDQKSFCEETEAHYAFSSRGSIARRLHLAASSHLEPEEGDASTGPRARVGDVQMIPVSLGVSPPSFDAI